MLDVTYMPRSPMTYLDRTEVEQDVIEVLEEEEARRHTLPARDRI